MRMAMKSRCRRFTIADGMVLVAVTAGGLAWSSRAWRMTTSAAYSGNPWGRNWQSVIVATFLITPCLLAWTVGMILLRLRSPRPHWRRVSRQPGMAACLAVLLSLLVSLPFYLALVVRELTKSPPRAFTWADYAIGLVELLGMVSPYLGFFVMMNWLLSAVQGRWQAEPGWIDRSGRLLGVLWIVAGGVIGAEMLKGLIG